MICPSLSPFTYCRILALLARCEPRKASEGMKEVLVAWRCRVPLHLFEVVDEVTGDFERMLDPSVTSAKATKHNSIHYLAIPLFTRKMHRGGHNTVQYCIL